MRRKSDPSSPPGRLIAVCTIILLAVFGISCDQNTSSTRGGSSSSSISAPPILQPFQGGWRFSLSKTIPVWRASGVPEAEITQAQAFASTMPLHPDMNIQGDTALLPQRGFEGSYQFFALHSHKQLVCGKLWHH